MTWLSMPVPIVRAYAAALPRLRAEESLVERDRISVGSGILKPHQSRQIQDRWIREVRSEDRAMRPASPSELSAMGFGYQKVKR